MDIHLSTQPARPARRTSPAAAARNHAPDSLLLHADSSDPDMRYFSRCTTFDPYLAFSAGGRKIAVSPIHEIDRIRSESDFDEVLSLPALQQEAAERYGVNSRAAIDESHLVRLVAEKYAIRSFRVGHRFPAGLLVSMRDAGIQVQVDARPGMFPERQIKTAQEITAIRKGNRASAAGFHTVARVLGEAKIRNGILHHQGNVLTSERLRDMINHACLSEGALAVHTIAAGGDQACDNHCPGHGPLRANELIVVDIFPQRIEDGYWGDMSRTYLKGKANDAQRRLVRTVRQAHRMALDMIKPGVVGGRVHRDIEDFFRREGYETCRSATKPQGFFHALGHGLGLEIHEAPIMRANSTFRFQPNMVVTVEPGLYYHGLGGARIEDVVQLVPGGCRKLSCASYRWEIP